MATYRLKVAQRGTIIVDGVDSLEQAEEYMKEFADGYGFICEKET